MKVLGKTLVGTLFVAASVILLYASAVWNSMDDLNDDGLILLMLTRPDAGLEHNPVRLPAPSAFKSLYWNHKGRHRLYAQLLISPELRTVARNHIQGGRGLRWIDPERADELLTQVVKAEREGVASIVPAVAAEATETRGGERMDRIRCAIGAAISFAVERGFRQERMIIEVEARPGGNTIEAQIGSPAVRGGGFQLEVALESCEVIDVAILQ